MKNDFDISHYDVRGSVLEHMIIVDEDAEFLNDISIMDDSLVQHLCESDINDALENGTYDNDEDILNGGLEDYE